MYQTVFIFIGRTLNNNIIDAFLHYYFVMCKYSLLAKALKWLFFFFFPQTDRTVFTLFPKLRNLLYF